jgi:hypothetical protein
VEAVQHAIEEILRMPDMSAPKHLSNEALDGLRSWHVKGFEDVRTGYCTGSETSIESLTVNPPTMKRAMKDTLPD